MQMMQKDMVACIVQLQLPQPLLRCVLARGCTYVYCMHLQMGLDNNLSLSMKMAMGAQIGQPALA